MSFVAARLYHPTLVLLALTFSMGSANAQLFRGDRRDRDTPTQPTGPTVNAAHENTKKQAEVAYRDGNYDEAIRLTSTVISQNPRDDVALYLRGSARVEFGIQRGDVQLVRDGIADTRDAIRFGGTNKFDYYFPYLYGMTNLSALEGRPNHAETSVGVVKGILDNPSVTKEQRANLLYQQGLAQVFLNRSDDAITSYSEAVRLVPLHIGANVGLADAYASKGQSDKALEAFDTAIIRFPDNPLIYNNRGRMQQQLENTEKAIADFSRAVQLDPNYFVAFTNLGFAKMDSGDIPAAERAFTSSLAINADQPTVYSLRGTARLAQGKVQEAMADYRKVHQLDPDNPVAVADLGFAKFFGGQYQDAVKEFDSAVSMDANVRYLDPWRYWAMVLSGQADAAKTKFAASLKKTSAQRDWIDLLVAYLSGSIGEEELLKGVNRKDDPLNVARNCEANYFIGQYKDFSGQADQAKKYYRDALGTDAFHLSAYRGSQYALKDFTRTKDSIESAGETSSPSGG